MQKINVKVHPTGRISLGCVPATDKLVGPNPPALDADSEWMALALKVHGGQAVAESGMPGTEKFRELLQKGSAPLGLSTPAKSLKFPIRGRKGISSHGRNLVKNAVWWLQNQYGKKRLTFATWTLPDSALKPELIQNWPSFTKLLKEKLQYHLRKAGLPQHMVGVTEIQEDRGIVDGMPPLHIHWIFVGRHFRKSWAISTELADKLILETIQNWVPTCESAKASGRLESVKKCVVAYLGKYLSKGSKSFAALDITDDIPLPPAWYLCTRTLARKAKRLVKHYQIDCRYLNPLEIEDIVKKLGGFWFKVWVGSEERSFVVGGVGGVPSKQIGTLTQI